MLQSDPAVDDRYHYRLIRRAIERIDAAETPPALDDLAAEMHMSPAHFQRTFSSWAGVSPKRFAQYLALGHAKALLRDRTSLLETALGTGLSGTGRLHDLFLRWEAMSPGEYARGGAGLAIRYGWFDGPFGEMLVMATERGICGLALAAETGRAAAFADMAGRWPDATLQEDPEAIRPMVEAVLRLEGEARLHMIGGPFQIKVWEALMQVPSGHVTTYGAIADAIGSPKAVRAVGTAVGRNPVSWLIPCHRALRKSGGLGGYHWGLPVKRALLAWETARAEAGA
ncbi:bifunctional helix-turn-helix domain-containing protein/methylated-DNA--[protein]-cysteine S-methyltransferase [uncultured Jannaschia sp.]|uniref:bifunctional helix-turn-helix domain-containing protein/methylated-DNA--[protein]-cysteine S-methyltransferase n=1 Tax=uncultured Jannaschia sp. TaxID=293347 RepID=UPI00261B9D70|nr:bifunctional helix-turn-helix domain-containing protein/methylated-DNA--[protein]-cysteine S-methyltransferase [uncultured Jannaschia sp.]